MKNPLWLEKGFVNKPFDGEATDGDYPTEEFEDYLARMDVRKLGWEMLVELLEDSWKYAEDGYLVKTESTNDSGEPILMLVLHTVGWSGNEGIINAMLSNYQISSYHTKWERGGHYFFEFPIGRIG